MTKAWRPRTSQRILGNHPWTDRCEEPYAIRLRTVLSERREREMGGEEKEWFTDGHAPKIEPRDEDRRPCEKYNRESIRWYGCLVPPTLHSCRSKWREMRRERRGGRTAKEKWEGGLAINEAKAMSTSRECCWGSRWSSPCTSSPVVFRTSTSNMILLYKDNSSTSFFIWQQNKASFTEQQCHHGTELSVTQLFSLPRDDRRVQCHYWLLRFSPANTSRTNEHLSDLHRFLINVTWARRRFFMRR